jgi:hypothetical protein
MDNKYKVLQKFRDAVTNVIYEIGDLYPNDTPKERIEELLGSKHENFTSALIEEVKPAPRKRKTTTTTDK